MSSEHVPVVQLWFLIIWGKLIRGSGCLLLSSRSAWRDPGESCCAGPGLQEPLELSLCGLVSWLPATQSTEMEATITKQEIVLTALECYVNPREHQH